MTIDERIAESERKFNELTEQRDNINTELVKLQGEWRVLQDLKQAESSNEPNKQATVIEAVPEENK